MSQTKTAETYFQEGEALFNQGKFFEANQLFDQTIQIDPKYMQAYRFKARCFSSQGKFDEAIEACKIAIAIDPNFTFIYNNLGMAYNSLGRFEEALETYDKAISIDPNFLFAYNNKGEALSNMGRKEEAIKVYSKAIEINPDEYDAYNGQALVLQELGRNQEALELYDKAVKKFPKNSLALCNQAKLLSKLGRNKEALGALRKVKEIYKNGFIDVKTNPQHLIFIQYAHEMITDLDNIESQTEEIIQQQDQQNPQGQKLVARVRTLQQKKETITAKLITGMDSQSSDDLIQEVERLKEEFLQIKQESVNMKKDVKQIKSQFEDIKEELDNKLDDFRKKFDGALTKTDFSSEDKAKLKEYFNSFLETFSSTHVTSQVIDSGQIQLDSDSSKATLLSVVASFAPFIGTALLQGVTSLANFLASKEIKANARKMKGLANDTTELSQIIGGAVYRIVLDKQKQQQILSVTNEDLKKISGKLLEKISKFCENIDEQIDGYLYTKMYKTASARLGHNDANKLIELWLVGKIDPYAVQEDMIKHALDLKGESEPLRKPSSQPENTDRSACCNMF